MNTHHVETILTKDGTLILERLPFEAGASVEVIILSRSSKIRWENPYPLQGSPLIYENPTEPVE